MQEACLFSVSERLPVAIGQIAFPSDISIFGNHFGDNTYYADFAGIARKYAPRRILEIGVRFGYSGIALCRGALAGGAEPPLTYVGLDGEFFSMEYDGPGGYTYYRSNAVAEDRFRLAFGDDRSKIDATWIATDTIRSPIPESVLGATFDLVNVDGDHSYEGASADCAFCWSLLAPDGIMVIDDIGMEGVRRAVEDHVANRVAAGEVVLGQRYANERGFYILQKKGMV